MLRAALRAASRASASAPRAAPSARRPAAPRTLAAGLNVHRDAVYNREDTPFEFSDENFAKIAVIRKRYPKNYAASAVIPLLDLAQRQAGGWLPLAAMNKVARILEMPPIRVYEVASFYTMFNRERVGRFNVQVCTTTPCMLRGGYEILDAIKAKLGVEVGGDTDDGLFHLMEVECLGACVNAPMVQINDDFYEDLTPASISTVLDNLKTGKEHPIGPQDGRNTCEGPMGRTTLRDAPAGPYCRPLTLPEDPKSPASP
jgi:NADH dehydrogenase (ubiquinone) flavoprotein 2